MGHKVEDWTYRVVGEEAIDGVRCHVIEALPRIDQVRTNSGYSKRLLWVRQDNYVTVKGDFWDQGGQAYKRYRAADIQLVDQARAKWQPMQMEMVNLQTDYRTVIRFVHFKVNQQVKDEFFTVRYLERG
jgi:negative regulator of sigma E activity